MTTPPAPADWPPTRAAPVADLEPASFADHLLGVQLFGLRSDEAVELLGAVADGNDGEDSADGDAVVEEIEAAKSITVLLHPG